MTRLLLVLLVLPLLGCEQHMANTPDRKPLDTSPIFSDGAAARLPVAGTVATDADLDPQPAALPAALPLSLLQRGQERFNVFCSPCHDETGHGHGRVVQRGFPEPPDFHSARLRAAPDRHFFDVITNGYGVMYPYGNRVPEADRWTITAYIRALQYADEVPRADLSPDLVAKLDRAAR